MWVVEEIVIERVAAGLGRVVQPRERNVLDPETTTD
jgi:hypothetical protein